MCICMYTHAYTHILPRCTGWILKVVVQPHLKGKSQIGKTGLEF